MKNEIRIYENGVLKKQLETEKYIMVAIEGDSVKPIRNMSAVTPIEAMCMFIELLVETATFSKIIPSLILDITELNELIETEESATADKPTEIEKVEMTPEVIEAIVQQSKQRANRARSPKSTVRRSVAKMLVSLAKRLAAQD